MPSRCQLLSRSLSIPLRPTRTLHAACRTFATSPTLHGRKGGDLGSHLPKHIIPQDAAIPPYPCGASTLFKQSNKGLYGGQKIQFGNNVSPKTETKTRRHWKPNIATKSLYSMVLKKKIKLRVTAKVIKTIDREGGLDEYLLKESQTRIKELGPLGWALRWTLMQTPEVIARFRAEAAAIGLAKDVIEQQWPMQPMDTKKTQRNVAERSKEDDIVVGRQVDLRSLRRMWKEHHYRAGIFLRNSSNRFRKRGLAPDHATALAMAKEEKARITREIQWAGELNTWRAWKHAKETGEVRKAGGDEGWLAQHHAKKLLWVQQDQPQEEPKTEADKSAKVKEEDGWGSLISAKRV